MATNKPFAVNKLLPVVALLLLLAACSSPVVVAQLVAGYYSKTCPDVEEIVRDEMEKIVSAAPSLAGPLLRLHFHDCFVRVSSLPNCKLCFFGHHRSRTDRNVNYLIAGL